MASELKHRVAKLHTDAGCCVRDYRDQRKTVQGSRELQGSTVALTALADEQRLAMFCLIAHYGALCACEIEAAFDLSHSTVIHHLNLLSEAGLLEARRSGKWSYYQLARPLPVWVQSLLAALGQKNTQRERCCLCSIPD